MTDWTRRRLLAMGGAITVGAIAGCSGSEEPGDNAVSTGDGSVLEAISLENLNDRAHTLDIIIQRNDEIVYWTTHDLGAISEGNSSVALGSELPTEPGAFQLTVRLDDDSRSRFSSTQLSERDCLELLVMVTRAGELSILTDVSGGTCSTESDDESEDDEDT